MTLVVTERCEGCCYTDCVEECPADCFYRIESPAMLVINPDTCIDCYACQDACPVRAIYHESEVPEVYAKYVSLNAELWSKGVLVTKLEPPARALSLEQVKARELAAGYGDVPDP